VIADPTDALPHARAEGAEVSRALSSLGSVALLSGAQASREAVLAALPASSFLHFAGHGRLGRAGPLDQQLQLSGQSALTLSDVLALSRAPTHVVLSACDAGSAAEESTLPRALSLAQAFAARGTRQVVAPVRPVDDAATARVITLLYRAYAQSRDLVSALRETQLALASESGSPATSFRAWVR
jgi:CHAT domain-containing protein